MAAASDKLERYLELLLAQDADGIVELFDGEPDIDDPVGGRLVGEAAVRQYVTEGVRWMIDRQAKAEQLRATLTPERGVVEWLLTLEDEDEEVELPVAVVADLSDDGITALRVYHSLWPLHNAHAFRPAILPGSQLPIPDVVGRYQQALAQGQVEAILAQFELDGMAREPSGGLYVYRGQDELREFYEELFSNGGGIGLEHCTVTDDGVCCAIEYNVVRWGLDRMDPQAGMAVYERGSNGKLASARIYDDVDPPLENFDGDSGE